MKRKIVSIILILCLVIGGTVNVFADKSIMNKEYRLNEYEYINELKQQSDATLRGYGYTKQEIEEIRNIDYVQILKERSKLEANILRNMGYSDEQITLLKDFKGSEEEINLLSSNCTISVRGDNIYYKDGFSYFEYKFSWRWSSMPAVQYKDIIGIGWSDGFLFHNNDGYSYHIVDYKGITTGNANPIDVGIVNGEATGTAKSVFDFIQGNVFWAESGRGRIQARKAGYIRECQSIIVYGHCIINLGIGVSFGIEGPCLGVSFSYGIKSMDQDVAYDDM